MVDFFQKSVHRFHSQIAGIIFENVMFRCGCVQHQQMRRRQIIHHNGMGYFRAANLWCTRKLINTRKSSGAPSYPSKLEMSMEFIVIFANNRFDHIAEVHFVTGNFAQLILFDNGQHQIFPRLHQLMNVGSCYLQKKKQIN